MSLNKIFLIGHVGKDPEIQYLATPERPKVAQFSLATTERYKWQRRMGRRAGQNVFCYQTEKEV